MTAKKMQLKLLTATAAFVLAGGSVLAWTGESKANQPIQVAQVTALTPEENNQICVKFYNSAWNKGDFDAVKDLISPDVIDHSPLSTETGQEGFKKIVAMFRGAMPGLTLTIDDMIFNGDRVVHRWTVSGKHTAEPLMGVKADGKDIKLTGITILRMVDGKIVERWTQLDMFGLQTQLGLIKPPAPPK